MDFLTSCQNYEDIAILQMLAGAGVVRKQMYGDRDVLISGYESDDSKIARNTECISDISQYAWGLALMGRRNDCGGVAEDPCMKGSEMLFWVNRAVVPPRVGVLESPEWQQAKLEVCTLRIALAFVARLGLSVCFGGICTRKSQPITGNQEAGLHAS
jgi:hypothetical protein